MEIPCEEHIDATEGADFALRIVLPGAGIWNGNAESLLGAGQELRVGQADLVHDEPPPESHGLEGIFGGSTVICHATCRKAKGFVDGLALEVCRVHCLEGYDLILQAIQACAAKSKKFPLTVLSHALTGKKPGRGSNQAKANISSALALKQSVGVGALR